jgi:hypothetical protein
VILNKIERNKMKTLITTALVATLATASFAHTALGDKELKVHSFKVKEGWSHFVLDTSHYPDNTPLHCVFFDADGIPVGTVQGYTDPIATSGYFTDIADSVKCLVV